jgi:transcriptional regulator with XRE-family HTH domain
MEAALKYLRAIREGRNLTQAQVARAAGVEPKQVYRWERGESEPTASGLSAYIAVVGAPAQEVQDLIADPSATPAEALRRAQRRLAEQHSEQRAAVDALDRAEQASTATAYDDPILAELQAQVRLDASLKKLLRGVLDAWIANRPQDDAGARPE